MGNFVNLNDIYFPIAGGTINGDVKVNGKISLNTAETKDINAENVDAHNINVDEKISVNNIEVSGSLSINNSGAVYDIASKIATLDSISNATPISLTRHYKMNNAIAIPWDSGTLVCDMNTDGSVFRLHGNTYKMSENDAWESAAWIPGTNNKYKGYKTFKVKTPSSGKTAWIDCSGIKVNTASESLSTGNLNYDHICVGTDGYVYVCIMSESPNNTSPVLTFYSGIICCVDSELSNRDYIYGDGSETGYNISQINDIEL